MAVLTNGVGSGQSGIASILPNSGTRVGVGSGQSGAFDREHFGAGWVHGVTRRKKPDGSIEIVPNAIVRLHLVLGAQLVRQGSSGPDGVYAFEGIKIGPLYYVIGFYQDGSYNAVIADRVSAETM